MTRSKYKILVLSDLKDNTVNTIKNGVSLAKIIDADIHLFHVKKPTDIVDQESQLSAIRTINRSFISTDSNIQDIIEPLSKDYDITISSSHAFGNLKSEISNFIKTYKPDAIILGKGKTKTFDFVGDNMVDFVIKNYSGVIMIASDVNVMEPNLELSLGVLNNVEKSFNMEFANSLVGHTQKPLKLFKTNTNKETIQEQTFSDKKIVEFLFDYGDNSMKSLSNYLAKSDIDLLCVNRQEKSNSDSKLDIKNVLNNVNVSLLISRGIT
jgi:hypothetical protein